MGTRHEILLIISTLFGSWLGMQIIHEVGHVIGAWITGGEVHRVVFHPLTISRTDLGHSPHPLFVAWSGPILGIVIPLVLFGLTSWLKLSFAFVLQFFAGFCLVANGLYIGLGSFSGTGDCGEMLRYGSPMWTMWVFGATTVPVGFCLWNGLGSRFGRGANPTEIDVKVAYGTFLVFCGLFVFGMILGGE